MHELSDAELLRDYTRHSSEEAFAELVRRHVNLVYSTALRHVGISASAEEITQAVFVILSQKAAGLAADTILEGWLYGTTRLTALRILRGERRRQFREQKAYMESTLHTSSEAANWQQLEPLLDEAMARLGKKDRDAVMLRFFKDKSLRDVALALRVNETAAQRRVYRAVEKLRRFFLQRGIVLPAAVLTAAIAANSVQAAPLVLAQSATAAALASGATASGSTLTLIKGALKTMAWTKAKTAIVIGVGALLVAGTASVTVLATGPGQKPGLLARYRQKEALIKQVDSMKEVLPAIIKYSQAHQDALPTTLAELKPYLPAELTGLDDEHWEMPAREKLTVLWQRPDRSDIVLMQQKNVPVDKAKIIVYADGSIMYKK